MSNTFFCRLPFEGILTIQGLESKKFLQGQLTCNLNYISQTHSRLGARCTPKGRMVSNFRILQQDQNSYLLSMCQPLIEKQLADLKKYAMFSKVELLDSSEQWVIFGLYGSEQLPKGLHHALPTERNQVTATSGQYLINIAPQYYQLICPKASAHELEQQLLSQCQLGHYNDWVLGFIRNGIAQIQPETSELFVPQMINLPAVGGVSFKKGCYTGQEIVARMQYLGKLKRHLYRLTFEGNQLPPIGTSVYSTIQSTSVGEVVLAAHASETQIELLAVLLDEALETPLWLDDNKEITLTRLSLPYTIDPDEEIKH